MAAAAAAAMGPAEAVNNEGPHAGLTVRSTPICSLSQLFSPSLNGVFLDRRQLIKLDSKVTAPLAQVGARCTVHTASLSLS